VFLINRVLGSELQDNLRCSWIKTEFDCFVSRCDCAGVSKIQLSVSKFCTINHFDACLAFALIGEEELSPTVVPLLASE